MQKKLVISGVGCALSDFLYSDISFSAKTFIKYQSKSAGDGGLSPGKLVFTEELESYAGKPYREILAEITGGKNPHAFNVGGPGLVSLIHVSQLLDRNDFTVRFYGARSEDKIAGQIMELIKNIPLETEHYKMISNKSTPFTDVLSDPDFDNGHGERTFINNIGAAWDYRPDNLDESFFKSDIVCFGGTALVPQIHDNLTALLIRAKQQGAITIVNTVFDFINEKANPGSPWMLGNSDDTFKWIDILIMDHEEALKITGKDTIDNACDYLKDKRVSSFIITSGANEIIYFSDGNTFKKTDLSKLPVSESVKQSLKNNKLLKCDTTGCGDNFAGGIIFSIAMQLQSAAKGYFDLHEAITWGVASGGFACFHLGGTYLENYPGEKLIKIKEIRDYYLNQLQIQA